tara:strand:+ start:509 stop:2095 length:1587 start_codon:yes stop_codon:yes gene_type:complete
MKKLLILAIVFFGVVELVSAQVASSTFNIRVFGGSDTATPTAPMILTSDAVSATQVDITWSTSTDNYLVGGYVVLRDDVAVATTSLLTYSDSGLTPSTTYAYRVLAFDTSSNYSTSSNEVLVTTPGLPVEVEEENGGSSGSGRSSLQNLSLDVGVSTTSINVSLNFPMRLEVRWGRTSDYELGYFVGGVYREGHTILLEELEPETTYVYEIVAITPVGTSIFIAKDSFTTNALGESGLVPNVSGFLATANESDVQLSWEMPAGDHIAFVRIVRSHLGVPEFPSNGAIVYQGGANEYIDEGVLSDYSEVYYTAFVYDNNGRVSSGAVASVAYILGDEVIFDIGIDGDAVDVPIFVVDDDRVHPTTKMPELDEVIVTQLSADYVLAEAPLHFNNHDAMIVSVPVETIAGNLKSIIVSISDPSNNRDSYSYLLRINNDRTAYEAVVANPGVAGKAQIQLAIYDYESYIVARYQAPIVFYEKEWQGVGFIERFVIDNLNLFLAGMLLAALYFLIPLLLAKRRRQPTYEDKLA